MSIRNFGSFGLLVLFVAMSAQAGPSARYQNGRTTNDDTPYREKRDLSDPSVHLLVGVTQTLAQEENPGILARERTAFPAIVLAVELNNAEPLYLRAEIVGAMKEQGGVSIPFADLRFTPYFFSPKDAKEGGVNFVMLSGNITRNVYTGNAIQGRAYLIGFEGQAVGNIDDDLRLAFEVAVKGIGVRIQQWLLAPAVQGSFGVGEARVDLALALQPHEYFLIKLAGGIWSALSIFPGSENYGIAFENDTRGYAQLSFEIAKLFELFVRGTVDLAPTTQDALFTLRVAPTLRLMGGIGVVF